MNKATWIFVAIQTLIIAMSARLLTMEGMFGIGVIGLVLCILSTWVFKIIETLQDK